MHGQECVSIHIRRISNEPAGNYPHNTDKGCALICTVKNVCLYTFDIYPMNLHETVQKNTNKECALICTFKNVSIHIQHISNEPAENYNLDRADKEGTRMCAASKHGFYTSKSQV